MALLMVSLVCGICLENLGCFASMHSNPMLQKHWRELGCSMFCKRTGAGLAATCVSPVLLCDIARRAAACSPSRAKSSNPLSSGCKAKEAEALAARPCAEQLAQHRQRRKCKALQNSQAFILQLFEQAGWVCCACWDGQESLELRLAPQKCMHAWAQSMYSPAVMAHLRSDRPRRKELDPALWRGLAVFFWCRRDLGKDS